MFDISFLGAALAGLLSFFTPCVLPMVPFYLAYMAGISMNELRGDGQISRGAQRRLVISAVAFALGVTTIFVLMGMGATAAGELFATWRRQLAWVAAAILFVFGLHFLGVLRIPLLYREARLESKAEPSTLFGAYLMGLAFGFGWTPCVGPALASILMIASGMGDVMRGGLLLLVYGISMTAPFVVAALFARPFLSWVQRHRRYLGHVEKAMGLMLILFAVLIATDGVNRIAALMIEWFPWFTSIG
ncbi:cytochrome c-type biogenesis protein [Meinhardsimonia xiamenensis]|jgi:cytochrome c-type biogenesis protein|uniref:Cytochrome c-type biogenesis protein n=1 Tax=Meinhardsimonia xiamenensis TaxID=990712 RepID=A0A1G9GFG1_9RHOB|nr:cytochrome c biogenesis CcdA family protein [Meinhardsimonia xiamenensis]PRX31915.1 cytochrome c-type biogenesis protein [Meinhardsimonia xiamenensis]SDK99389.1 cytochrome c-type biogenesis protein [Meinhardsimonia xiamenensis]